MKILIIEDDVAVATVLAEAIELDGHEVTVARDGGEGLARLAEAAPDAIFLDIVMPGLSGIEVLRRIRQGPFAGIPVIVLTGQASPNEMDEARSMGVTEIIEKPVILKNLESALGELRRRKGR